MPAATPGTPAPLALVAQFTVPLTREDLDSALASAMEKVARQIVEDEQVIPLVEAVALTPWNATGFKRVATRENLPFIKGPHKSPPSYRRGDVIAMLQRMRVWPKGRPADVVPFSHAA